MHIDGRPWDPSLNLAEGAGTLTKLAVAEGDVIQEGDLIAVIE